MLARLHFTKFPSHYPSLQRNERGNLTGEAIYDSIYARGYVNLAI